MKNIYNPIYIKGNELAFYITIVLVLLIIILTTIFVIKEIKKK